MMTTSSPRSERYQASAAAHTEPGADALNRLAFSATVHCLTGCAIGETLGMGIGTAAGFSDLGTVALAVGLAFFFGYSFTAVPLLRSGLALAAVLPIALAADTISITIMEIVDNAIMLLIPGAMEAGPSDPFFSGSLAVALLIAGIVAFPANRWLIARGKGHAVAHQHPNPRMARRTHAIREAHARHTSLARPCRSRLARRVHRSVRRVRPGVRVVRGCVPVGG